MGGSWQKELAFELSALNGVECIVVDPQPIKISRLRHKLRAGWYHRTEPLQKYNTCDAWKPQCSPPPPAGGENNNNNANREGAPPSPRQGGGAG